MKKDDGKLTQLVRVAAGLSAIAIGYGSAKLSVAGIGLGGDLWWLNWVIAISLFVAEFIVNGKHEEITWTILAVGFGAYCYSIWTNIVGIEAYKVANGGINGTLLETVTIYAGGFFMDIYPELVLRWALGEGKVGDAIGNLVKTYQHPEILTKAYTTTSASVTVQPHQNGAERRRQLESERGASQPYRKSAEMEEDNDASFIRPMSQKLQFSQQRPKPNERRSNTL